MTLHEPKDGIGLDLERSTKGCAALVSCKKEFSEEPNHVDFISEVDQGNSIFRCSGWRNVSNISFIDSPPFLIFDIPAYIRAKIISLDEVPLQVSLYDETYKLGGVTSFVPSRKHYFENIPCKDGYLFYDGLPSHNPVLKKCNMSRIHGDISLLVLSLWKRRTTGRDGRLEETDDWKRRTTGRDGRLEEMDDWKRRTTGRDGRLEETDDWKRRTS